MKPLFVVGCRLHHKAHTQRRPSRSLQELAESVKWVSGCPTPPPPPPHPALADPWIGSSLPQPHGTAATTLPCALVPCFYIAEGVEVDISDRKISVLKPGVYELDLPLPYAVDADSVQAKWLKKHRILQVTMTRAVDL